MSSAFSRKARSWNSAELPRFTMVRQCSTSAAQFSALGVFGDVVDDPGEQLGDGDRPVLRGKDAIGAVALGPRLVLDRDRAFDRGDLFRPMGRR